MNCFRKHVFKARVAFQPSRKSEVMTVSSSDIPASGSAIAPHFLHSPQSAFRCQKPAIAIALKVKRSVTTSHVVRSNVFAARQSASITKNHNQTGIIKC